MVLNTKVYFARPDALSGSLVETLRIVNPTIFFGVPRIFEKFEERIKIAIESSSFVKRKVIKWAMKIGSKAVDMKFKNYR
jgi:long-chain-fatty-acid--CoA ligase ACSBG